MKGLPVGNLKVLRGRTEPLPQLSGTAIGIAHFGRGDSLNGVQHRTQGAAKFEFQQLALRAIRQQR